MEINVISVYDFNELYNSSWGGAIDTLKTIEENEKEDELIQLLDDLLSTYWIDGGINRTKLNDMLWFDRDYIFESLGIKEED